MKISLALFLGLVTGLNCLASDSQTLRMELSPQLVAAAGLTTDQLVQLRDQPSVAQALLSVRNHATDFRIAHDIYKQAQAKAHLLGTGAGGTDDLAQLKAQSEAAETALKQARLAAHGLIIQEIANCCGELASQVAANCYTNIHRAVPFHWKAIAADQATWDLLESAAQKLKHHEELTDAELNAYQLVLFSEDVAIAKGRIESNAPALEMVYVQWLMDELQSH